jgi:hypothetical protein
MPHHQILAELSCLPAATNHEKHHCIHAVGRSTGWVSISAIESIWLAADRTMIKTVSGASD